MFWRMLKKDMADKKGLNIILMKIENDETEVLIYLN